MINRGFQDNRRAIFTLAKKRPNYKYYAGYLGNGHGLIFRSEIMPTSENHPANVKFCFGGYSTRKQAEQTAMYQGYIIDNDWKTAIPLWPRDF